MPTPLPAITTNDRRRPTPTVDTRTLLDSIAFPRRDDRRAEARSTAERRLDHLVQFGHVGLWERNLETGEFWIADRTSEMLGRDADRPTNLTRILERIHPSDRGSAASLLAIEGAPSGVTEGRFRLRHESGRYHWMHSRTVVISETGQAPFLLGTLHDVTADQDRGLELERLNRELRRSNAQLEQVAALAGDDLRSPVRAIAVLADCLAEDASDVLSADASRNLDRLRRRIDRLDTMLTDLLAGTGHEDPAADATLSEPQAIVDRALSLLEVPPAYSIDLDWHSGPLRLDGEALAEALARILVHTIDTHPFSFGQILVSGEQADGSVFLAVTTDGPSADPSERQHHPGFTTARTLTERHGGDCHLESDPQHGVSVHLRWPLGPTS